MELKQTGVLPPQLIPFIGRHELSEIVETLQNPNCRLLTLVGAGGSGKTRIAIETAYELQHQFDDGVRFVPLQAVPSAEYVASSIADAVMPGLRAENEAEAPLLNYLSDKSMLIVLDSFEHLLASNALLRQILISAPYVKLLLTSREILNLREEWLYPVNGMRVPELRTEQNLMSYDSVQLFMEHARRLKHDFSLENERESVIRICRAVEGMPLGIELAASWLRALPAADIATEIERGLDFLETHQRDVPERHRSMRAVFDQSWKLLSDREREMLKRVSVFQGGFEREAARHVAAQNVAATSLITLTALVDKSLLLVGADGRYTMHGLLRQYAEECLNANPQEAKQARDAMDTYYANLMKRYGDELLEGRSKEAILAIDAELENMRVVWNRICHESKFDLIDQSLYVFAMYYDYRGLFIECERAFCVAVTAFENHELDTQRATLLYELYVWLGWAYIRTGKIESAGDALNKALAIIDEFDVQHRPGLGSDVFNALAILEEVKGNFQASVDLALQAVERAKQIQNDKHNLSLAYYALAGTQRLMGQLSEAHKHARLAYETALASGNQWFMGYCLIVQGSVARAMGNDDEAERCFRECYDIRREFNDPEGMALALVNLGMLALLRDNATGALKLFNSSLEIYRDLHDPGGLIYAYNGRGATYRSLNRLADARQDLLMALDVANETALTPRKLMVLAEIAALFLRFDDHVEAGVSLLKALQAHSALEQETADVIQKYMQRVDAERVRQVRAAQGDVSTLAAYAKNRLNELELSNEEVEKPLSMANQDIEGLLDPLTERELEILTLLGQGLTNQQIADRLVVVIGTIKAHNHNIFSKLGVRNRVQAVTRAQELELI